MPLIAIVKKFKGKLVLCAVVLLMCGISYYVGIAPFSAKQSQSDVSSKAQITAALNKLNANVIPDEVRPSSVPGLWEVVAGTQVIYITADGKKAIDGAIVDLESMKNLTEEVVSAAKARLLATFTDDELQIYPVKGEVKRRIYVFTDPTCSYCQRFHSHLNELASAGIEVAYLGFPRAGARSEVADQLSNAFCAPDRAFAFEMLMKGEQLGTVRCLSPLNHHLAVAEQFGVSGTPAIFTAEGKQLGGYMEPSDLVKTLGL